MQPSSAAPSRGCPMPICSLSHGTHRPSACPGFPRPCAVPALYSATAHDRDRRRDSPPTKWHALPAHDHGPHASAAAVRPHRRRIHRGADVPRTPVRLPLVRSAAKRPRPPHMASYVLPAASRPTRPTARPTLPCSHVAQRGVACAPPWAQARCQASPAPGVAPPADGRTLIRVRWG